MNGPAGFSDFNAPDDAGLKAVGWVIVTISSQNYYLPAWQEG